MEIKNLTDGVDSEQLTPQDNSTAQQADIVNDSNTENDNLIDENDLENSVADQESNFSDLSLEELTSTLVDLVSKTVNISEIKIKVGNIKAQYLKKIKQIKQDHFDSFIKEGGIEEEYETIKYDFEQKYEASINLYKEKRAKYLQNLENEKEANLKEKQALLESLRNMINSDENLNKIYNEFKELQNRWKEIGLIPQSQVNGLWENYHFLVEKFFDKVKINKELMVMGLSKNLEEKIALCEKMEDLLLEKSVNKSFKMLQEYHEKWKAIGPVPQEKSNEIWERFRASSDKVNKKRHDYYEAISEEQKNNLILKTELCEKMELLKEEKCEDSKSWSKVTDSVNEIFEIWKTIGPAPKKYNDSIWKRFKTSVDIFYNNKKEFLDKIKDEQMNNYHLKLDLIAQAESIKNSQNWKETTFEFVNIQKKWKEIGPTPKKYSDKIWKKFRDCCDVFFANKEKFFSTIGDVEKENKEKKLALIDKITNFKLTENKEENLKAIKDFQNQWFEIGKVAFKEMESIKEMYKKAVEKHLNELNINSFEFEHQELKNKISKGEDKKDNERIILKEMSMLRSKIDNLQKDVNIWETNISFFANSKNADLLKSDFDKKIAKAKKEIDILKSKVRQFDKMIRDINK